jgi:hypothetical protein
VRLFISGLLEFECECSPTVPSADETTMRTRPAGSHGRLIGDP